MNLSLRDAFYIGTIIVAVSGSHFSQQTQIAVLEERYKNTINDLTDIKGALRRIEEKLDTKADR